MEEKKQEINNDKIINIGDKGNLKIITDLHGNYSDYKKYKKIWNKKDLNSHILITGDFIHGYDNYDESLKILEDIIKNYKLENFHVLLGNHEWAHITNSNIYKNDINQKRAFEKDIIIEKGYLEPFLFKAIDFFKQLPIAMITDNKIFISHAGPSKKIKSLNDIKNIDYTNRFSKITDDLLWNRFSDYNIEDINNFLEIVDCNVMVVGHTPVNGFKIIGNQMVISSSFNTKLKTYLDIDLGKKIKDIDDLKKMIKYL